MNVQSLPGAASGSPVPGRGVDGAAAPATGPALSSAVWAIRAWHVLRLSFVVAAVLGVGLVALTGCGEPAPTVAAPAIGERVTRSGDSIAGLSEDRNNSDMLRLDDGTYIVGADIWPGTYRSAGAVDSAFPFCFWSTNKGQSTNSEVIDIGSAGVGEQQVVKIGKGVGAFDTSGCEPWEKIG